MAKIGKLYQSADWKSEKHVPVIESPAKAKEGENFQVTVTLGKEVAHPNTTEHHIAWIKVYFMPEGGKFPYQIGSFEFTAHGASTDGPDTSTVYTHHGVTCTMKTGTSGTIIATSLCNIHGLWENSAEITIS